MSRMQPLSLWPTQERSKVRGVFADIDDTLTTDGRMEARVFAAMERLRAQGLCVIPITGRPAGWCDMIARTWPVDGVVGENGAFYFRYDTAARRMLRVYTDEADVRQAYRERLAAIRDEVLTTIPVVAVSADQSYRETDLAIDFNEDVSGVPQADIDAIVAVFERHGATAKVSSIHVNGWFGSYDKLTMTKRLMDEVYGVDLENEKQNYIFVGDSPNDAPMFGFFPHAVGVANFVEFQDRCAALPAWITPSPGGVGFVELADLIVS